jgi:hypothetical protein
VTAKTGLFRESQLLCRECGETEKRRCAGCGKPIIEDLAHACGSIWHVGCFTCQVCHGKLEGQRFAKVGQKPLCIGCYERQRAERKGESGRPVVADSVNEVSSC